MIAITVVAVAILLAVLWLLVHHQRTVRQRLADLERLRALRDRYAERERWVSTMVCARCGATRTMRGAGPRYTFPSGVNVGCKASGHDWKTQSGASTVGPGTTQSGANTVGPGTIFDQYTAQYPNRAARLRALSASSRQEREAEEAAERERLAAEWQRIHDELRERYRKEEPNGR